MKSQLRTANPPSKPLLIWDGDCHFCRHWIERWRVMTSGAVDYVTSQEIGDKFPEVPRDQFQQSVVYIVSTGEVFFGAEAVYRSLQSRSSKRWLTWSYNRVPGFATISEFGYRLIARHRGAASFFTRFLWGKDVRPPSYFWARRWFLRMLGGIYLIAFVSLWTQIDGLIGENGISPVRDFLAAAREHFGGPALSILPTLCWLNSSNAFLHFLCGAGVVLSLLLIFEIAPAICLSLLFVSYLSLTLAGQAFLSFQWDILLLETGFLAMFFAPWNLWPNKHLPPETAAATNRPALFLLKLLLFKLMVMSGVVKLASGDDSWGWVDHSLRWSSMTALDYHYWSQPLPTIFAWYADKSPEWFKHFSVAICLFIEIIVPIFIWAPRRLRLIACGLLIFLQIAIAITGNYCFFNLLTLALCLLLIDDGIVASLRRGAASANFGSTAPERRGYNLSILAAAIVIIVTLPLNVWLICSAFDREAEMPKPIRMVYERVEPLRIVNGYGLFRVMTKDRGEIIVEGSADGVDWRPYEFKWKPGDVMRAPGWCAPHQPRLDWQMWFAALGSPRQNEWFLQFERCLLEGKQDVTRLLKTNPFPEKPPRYIRAVFYRYRFTTTDEDRQTGAWWKREELGEYFPSFSLDDLKRAR
jgi:predicted DCC family thiol-disulfide oxidoreductase YuxK